MDTQLLIALAAALVISLVGAAFVNHWHQVQARRQKQMRLLQRQIDQTVAVARSIGRFLDQPTAAVMLIRLAQQLCAQLRQLGADATRVSNLEQALVKQLEHIQKPREQGPDFVLSNEVEISAAKSQLSEAAAMLNLGAEQGVIEADQLPGLQSALQWAQLQVEVCSNLNQGDACLEKNKFTRARKHYKHALQLLRRSTQSNPLRLEQIKTATAKVKELEARAVTGGRASA